MATQLKSRNQNRKKMDKLLLQACKKVKTTGEQVTALLDAGADANVVDNEGNSALMWSCRSLNVPVTRALLDMGADMNYTNKGYSALLLMCETDAEIANMADITQSQRQNAIRSTIEIVRMLLRFRAHKTVRNPEGKTPYQIAVTPEIRQVLRPLHQQIPQRLPPQAQKSFATQMVRMLQQTKPPRKRSFSI